MADCGWVLVMPDACPFCYGVNLAVEREQPITKPYKIQKSGQHAFSFSYNTDCFSTIVVIINPQVLPRCL